MYRGCNFVCMHTFLSFARRFTFWIIGFLSLNAAYTQVVVTRGPYLQLATANSMRICWRTNTPTDSRVLFGPSPSSLTQVVVNAAVTSEHDIQITGLQPGTLYYYAIGNGVNILSSGPSCYFRTHPESGDREKHTFWVIGDCGTANNDQRAVRDAYLNYMGGARADGIIMLGDNAYTFGTDAEYQGAVFSNMYESIIRHTVMWPCPGNHDYYGGADASTQSGAYYDIFHLPVAAENGGYPSGTEAYYSFDYGNIHFISLDSYDSGRDSTNAMGNWLKADLQQNQQEWTIVYWHHSPYTKGNHNSDNPFPYLDGELPEMRQEFLPILERYGVDLVLTGHSHAYERSVLMDGHYGNSGSLTQSMMLDNSSGDFVNDCPYRKNTVNSAVHKGTVYTVCGVSGKKDGTSSGWPLAMMHTASVDHLGSMVITVEKNRLDARFITSNNQVFDSFTILKNSGGRHEIVVCPGDSVVLEPSFPTGMYRWFPGNVMSPEFTFSPYFNTTYYGSDTMGCVTDTFRVVVLQQGAGADTCAGNLSAHDPDAHVILLHPNPVVHGFYLHNPISKGATAALVQIIDLTGREVYRASITASDENIYIPVPVNAVNGLYLLKVQSDREAYQQKFIIQP